MRCSNLAYLLGAVAHAGAYAVCAGVTTAHHYNCLVLQDSPTGSDPGHGMRCRESQSTTSKATHLTTDMLELRKCTVRLRKEEGSKCLSGVTAAR